MTIAKGGEGGCKPSGTDDSAKAEMKRAVELLKDRYGGGMEESYPEGKKSSAVDVSNESNIQENERQFNIKTKKGRNVSMSLRIHRKKDGGSVSYEKTPREEFGIMINPQAEDPYALSNIRDHGNEVRDLYAHEMLRLHGFNVVVRSSKAIGSDGKQLDCVSNVDLDIDGVMWEVKSPTEFGPKTIRQQLRKAVKRNFKNPYDDITMNGLGGDITPRVVINLKYVDTGNIDVVAEVASEMAECRAESVLIITGDGTVTEIKK